MVPLLGKPKKRAPAKPHRSKRRKHKPPKRYAAGRPSTTAQPTKPQPVKPAGAVKPPVPPPPGRPPQPPPNPQPPPRPPEVFGGDFGNPQLKRLLWRAGFGPRPGDVDRLAGSSLDDVVRSLTRPQGEVTLHGPEPRDEDGPLDRFGTYGHDHLWWLDRMVRSDQQLVERMTLIWHDWFATSNTDVNSQRLMLDQNALFRANALGSFRDILLAVSHDPAMLVWQNGVQNSRGTPNENYAREVMELFTLGADRGAYTETDVRQLALALTGWAADWSSGPVWSNFRYEDGRHDHSTKTIFGQSGDFDWRDACRLLLENPHHASFFVTKLWGYFIPTPPDVETQAALQQLYLASDYGIRPVVEAILMHPDFHDGPAMVKPPVVYNAGLLRAVGRGVDTKAWVALSDTTGQHLFWPPSVAGWDDSSWLDSSRWRGRWEMASYLLDDRSVPWPGYDPDEDADTGLRRALGFFGNPTLTDASRAVLLDFSTSCLPVPMQSWDRGTYRAMRQNALRHLVATCPDYQTC
jgi:hypothetical protein